MACSIPTVVRVDVAYNVATTSVDPEPTAHVKGTPDIHRTYYTTYLRATPDACANFFRHMPEKGGFLCIANTVATIYQNNTPISSSRVCLPLDKVTITVSEPREADIPADCHPKEESQVSSVFSYPGSESCLSSYAMIAAALALAFIAGSKFSKCAK